MKQIEINGVLRNCYCGCDHSFIAANRRGCKCLGDIKFSTTKICPKCGFFMWAFPNRWRKNS